MGEEEEEEEELQWTNPRSSLDPLKTYRYYFIFLFFLMWFVFPTAEPCFTWNGVVQAKSQKTSNKHLSGQKNSEDLIQFRDTYIATQ